MSDGKFQFKYISELEIKVTLLCSVASEDLAIYISSVEVVPIFVIFVRIYKQRKWIHVCEIGIGK